MLKNKKEFLSRLIVSLALLLFISLIPGFKADAAGWKKKGNNWQYEDGNNKIVKKKWMAIDGRWYYFNKKGNMVTGLKTIKGKTYYFSPATKGQWRKGMRMYGWQYVDGKYMYFSSMGVYLPECSSYENGSIKGIDVSQFQGNINWGDIKRQGVDFTFIRIGHSTRKLDPYFQTNMMKASATGIKTGIYFYSTAKSTAVSKKDAKWVIRQLRGYNVNYPVAIDMEDNSVARLGREKVTRIAKAFCDEISAAGYTPMVYLNENWALHYLDLSKLPGVYRWVARYDGSYNSSINRDIWQSGSTLLFKGIDVNSVDINFCYRDFSEIVTPRTKPIDSYSSHTKGFQKSALGTWYDKGDGSFPYSCWMTIGDKTYYFDSDGYLISGWLKTVSGIYYINEDGSRAENQWVSDEGLYYLGPDGKLLTGWNVINGKKYYMDDIGRVQFGWISTAEGLYYASASGTIVINKWIDYEGMRYYLRSDGRAAVGRLMIEGKEYYFKPTCELAINETIDDITTDENGVIITQQ